MENASSSQPEPSIRTAPTDTTSITAAVVTAVTEANGTKPATPLYEVINPDALEDLYQHGSPEVNFEYIRYKVTIHPDRTVTVSELNTSRIAANSHYSGSESSCSPVDTVTSIWSSSASTCGGAV